MNKNVNIIYWVIIAVLIILYFIVQGTTWIQTIYFVSSLLPIAIGSSYFFNRILIPKFLLPKKYGLFILYTSYSIIISLYLETLMLFLSLIVFSYFQQEGKNVLTIDSISLALIIILAVLCRAFISILKTYSEQENYIKALKIQKSKNDTKAIQIKANRTNQQIILDELIYMESLGDQLKFITKSRDIINRDKISKIHESLPNNFIRIHRSFVVNKNFIESFSADHLIIHGEKLPISRTYKQNVKETFS